MSQSLRRRRASELVNTPDVLLLVLSRCDPVTVSRCRHVCRKWRATIDEALGGDACLLQPSEGHARIVICDRRRAILERINEDQDAETSQAGSLQGAGRVQSSPELMQQPLDTTLACVKMSAMRKAEEQRARRGWTVKKATFWKDQYAHQGIAGWSFKFDLSSWMSAFEVDEVWLENFGSFLERSAAATDSGSMFQLYDSKEQGSARNPFPTPPHSQEALKGSPRANAVAAAVVGANRPVSPPTPIVPTTQNPPLMVPSAIPTLHGDTSVPYNLLPSTQVARIMESEDPQHVFLDDQMCAEMARISGGRFERLIAQMEQISPLHVVFKDHSLYPRRPTMLLFWFLRQLKANLRKVTFDNVQGEQRVKLENVLDLTAIEELNIVQPPKKQAIEIDADTLNAFIDCRQHAVNPRPFRLRICGKTGITAQGLHDFLKKWQNQPNLTKFDFIQIDAASVPLPEWFKVVRANSYLKQQCDSELDQLSKNLIFRHAKTHCKIRYYHANGYLFFKFVDPNEELRRRTASSSSNSSTNENATSSFFQGSFTGGAYRQNSSSSSFYSSSSSRKNSHDRRFMQNEYDLSETPVPQPQSMFTRIMGYILSSHA